MPLRVTIEESHNDLYVDIEAEGFKNGGHSFFYTIEVGDEEIDVSGKIHAASALSPLELTEKLLTSVRDRFEGVE